MTFELSVGDGECDISASITPGINGAALQVGCPAPGIGAQRAGSNRERESSKTQRIATHTDVCASCLVSDKGAGMNLNLGA